MFKLDAYGAYPAVVLMDVPDLYDVVVLDVQYVYNSGGLIARSNTTLGYYGYLDFTINGSTFHIQSTSYYGAESTLEVSIHE